MNEVLEKLPEAQRGLLRKSAMPSRVEPMLATLHDEPFSSREWVYERKLDGERCLVYGRSGGVSLVSRNGKRLDGTYPELVDALRSRSLPRIIADGEVVAFRGRRTSFARLQQRLGITDPEQARQSGVRVYLYLFDILYLDGMDLTRLPLRTRKQVLRRAIRFADPLRYTAHRNREGEKLLKEACRKGWEGLIAKRAESRYVHGRSREWLKLKCSNRQELVIGGYTDPRGSRRHFGALLLGYYENGSLRYAGRVGTGFDERTLAELAGKLKSRRRKKSPFADDADGKHVHWVSPTLVAEIAFTEWTSDGRLRHPRYVGLRHDKPARKVVREEPG